MKKPKALSHDVASIALSLYEALDTPLSLSQAVKLREKQWDAILDVSLDPRSYTDAGSYLKDAAAVAFLKKYAPLPTTVDRRAKALEKWWAGERDCYRTNLRLSPYLSEYDNTIVADERNEVISRMFRDVRKIVRGWIGNGPKALTSGRFGPGATFVDKAGRSTVPDKISSLPTLTHNAWPYLPQWLGTAWGAFAARRYGELNFVRGNRFSTAPKDGTTDRSIGVEASINVFYQLGIGAEIKQCLAAKPTSTYPHRAGWDMKRAQMIHKLVARESSLSLRFDTADLSNASDTVAKVLVKLSTPHGWYTNMEMLRSVTTKVDGREVVLEKFSSMGNGFTFELETVIFAALVCWVMREHGLPGLLGVDVFVYGDDIIYPTGYGDEVKSVLRFCGFTLNEGKTFVGGTPFRESCGGDFYAGVPVRPHYLKKDLNGPQDYIALANGIRRLYEKLQAVDPAAARRVLCVWFRVLDCLPHGVRSCRGPTELGDIVIHDAPEYWSTKHRRGIRYLRVYRPHRYKTVGFGSFDPEVVLACATYGTGNTGTPVGGRVPDIEGVIPRDGVLSYKVGWTPWS